MILYYFFFLHEVDLILFGVGQLFCHDLTQGEQRLLQPYQETGQTEHHIQQTHQDFSEIVYTLAQNEMLETKNHQNNRQHIPHCIQQRE